MHIGIYKYAFRRDSKVYNMIYNFKHKLEVRNAK